MSKILFVTAGLDYSGAARQLTLVAPRLPPGRFRSRVCVLRTSTPWGEQLRTALASCRSAGAEPGAEVSFLGWARRIDLPPFCRLYAEVRDFQPDVLHVWGLEALRAITLCGGRRRARLVVSAAVEVHRPPTLLDRWLLRRADALLAFGEAEARRYEQAGVPRHKITVVRPAFAPELLEGEGSPGSGKGVGEPPPAPVWNGVSPETPVLLAVGPVHRHKGFREAVWAVDLLGNLFPEVVLVLAGDGPDRERIARFARSFGTWRRVHFVGRPEDLGPLYRRASVVWAPSQKSSGVCAALEGMAAGRPVVATRCPALAEVVVEGQTGFLVDPGDPADLARQTRRLLDDPGLGREVGGRARRHVAAHYPVERLVDAAGVLYGAGVGIGL